MPELPLSILHYLADVELDRGGIVRSVLDLTEALAARGHRVGLATCNPVDVPAGWGGAGTPTVIPLRRVAGGVRFTRSSSAVIAGLLASYDVVHFNNIWNPELVHFARLARAAGKPYVLTPHGTLDPWSMAQSRGKKRGYLVVAGGRLLRGAAGLHFTAAEEQRAASRWVVASMSAVIPCVLDLSPFAAKASCPHTGPPLLLFMGRLHEKKRPELLISATALLRERGISVRVVLAGTGSPAYVAGLKAQVSRLDLSSCVSFPGHVGGDDKIALYHSADLFVVPTSQENFGIVFAEALASGVPVVATKGTDIWQELADTGGAVICDLEDVASPAATLAGVLSSLLADPTLRETMSAAGPPGVRAWLDPDETCLSFARFYRDAIERYRG